MSFHLPCGLMQANARSGAPEDITPWSRKFCWKDNGALLDHRLTLILEECAEQMMVYLNARKLLSGMESWAPVAGSERLYLHHSLLDGTTTWEMLSCNLCLSVQTLLVISGLFSFSSENGGECLKHVIMAWVRVWGKRKHLPQCGDWKLQVQGFVASRGERLLKSHSTLLPGYQPTWEKKWNTQHSVCLE